MLLLATPAFANVDQDPPLGDATLSGPYHTIDAYCGDRRAAHASNATCEVFDAKSVDLAMPLDRTSGGIRAVRIVTIDVGYTSTHILVQTSQGWFGREVTSAGEGDYTEVIEVSFKDLVGDAEPELYVEATHTHEPPCGCDADLWHTITYAYVCTIAGGKLGCTEPIQKSDDMHLANISKWNVDWTISKGVVKPKLRDKQNISKREQRALEKPFRLRFKQ